MTDRSKPVPTAAGSPAPVQVLMHSEIGETGKNRCLSGKRVPND